MRVKAGTPALRAGVVFGPIVPKKNSSARAVAAASAQ